MSQKERDYKRFVDMQRHVADQLGSISEFGRSFSWKALLATDDMFDDQYNNIEIACGCYDG